MNPPYGREIKHWAKKSYEEWEKGAVVVCLVPSRTDTAYWHSYFMHATEIRFVEKRIKFGGLSVGAPFPSAIVIFGKSENNGKNYISYKQPNFIGEIK